MVRVEWKVKRTILAECPYYKPDIYTGEYPTFHCDVVHYKDVIDSRSQDFLTKKEAELFITKAPTNCYDFTITDKISFGGVIQY